MMSSQLAGGPRLGKILQRSNRPLAETRPWTLPDVQGSRKAAIKPPLRQHDRRGRGCRAPNGQFRSPRNFQLLLTDSLTGSLP
jgi:hypothetical protein